MRYMSIDIETTGLDPKVHSILEVGAVCTEITKDHARAHELRLLVVPQGPMVIDPYCAKLHTTLWDELIAHQKKGTPPMVCRANGDNHIQVSGQCWESKIAEHLLDFVDACWPEHTAKKPKITVAGKNAASFDLPFLRLRANLDDYLDVRHRVLDVAPFFWRPGDDVLPSMDVCLQRAGIAKSTKHGALDDAYLVVELVDNAFEIYF